MPIRHLMGIHIVFVFAAQFDNPAVILGSGLHIQAPQFTAQIIVNPAIVQIYKAGMGALAVTAVQAQTGIFYAITGRIVRKGKHTVAVLSVKENIP